MIHVPVWVVLFCHQAENKLSWEFYKRWNEIMEEYSYLNNDGMINDMYIPNGGQFVMHYV